MSKTINQNEHSTKRPLPANGGDVDFRAFVSELGLADPEERPNAHIVIFDGDCRFCQVQVKRLNWFDGGNRLAFLSLHDPRAKQLCPDLSHEQMMEQMYILANEDGRVGGQPANRYGGAAAIRFVSRVVPQLWWAAPIMHIPFSLPVWQWMYMKVAVQRYRWNEEPGEECEDACEFHLKK